MNGFAAIAALAIVYVCGYVTGSLLVAPHHDRTSVSLGIVRLLAGLLLTSIGFLLSVESGLPWFAGPVLLVIAAIGVHRRAAFALPHLTAGWNPDTVVAVVLAALAVAPPVTSALRMAPGDFPPVFFNVDVPYFLEKVHALVGATAFPPESLSVADGRRSYHFGLHGVAAVIVRGSGIAPHRAVFLILVPLLAVGMIAAAFVLRRGLCPAVPSSLAVPLVIVAVPTLWYDFWRELTPVITATLSSGSGETLRGLMRNWELWGATSNIQNLGGHFLTLAALGALATPALGWRLPAFVIGSAMIFKSPAGVALMAGLGLAQAWRSIASRSLAPMVPAVAAGGVFAIVYGAFWLLPPVPADLEAIVSPFFYLDYIVKHGGLQWLVADLLWLVLPGLMALVAVRNGSVAGSSWLLFFALGPFIVVNVLRLNDLRGFLTNSMNEDDWRQIVMPLPLVLHAFALSVIGARWTRMSSAMKAACAVVMAIAVSVPLYAAARYTQLVVTNEENAHEFADNRAIAAALSSIPVDGSLIVTNDLRYPADGFRRDNRQMQIPSLFGHQAFAVNYVYEAYDFSRERLQLQQLLEAPAWSGAIDDAARVHRWTHFLVRKDYQHPDPIPLERTFENNEYVVYRFPP